MTTTDNTNRFADGCAWIEGEWVPIAQARIPILDTGFIRSDLTYDVAAVWEGRFFRLDDHIDRLLSGCEKLRLTPPLSRGEIKDIMIDCVRRSGLRNAYVEVIVTRGVPGPGERDPRKWTPCFYAFAIPYIWIVRPELQETGADVVIAQRTQRIPPNSVDPTVKNFHWGDLVRGQFEAYDRGSSFGILPDSHGMVTEGAGYNVFAMINGTLRTPARGVLLGITRRSALEIAEEAGIPCMVGDLSVDELRAADEVFITSTAGGIMPVATLDGTPIGAGSPGPHTTKIRDEYWRRHADPAFTEQVDY